MASPTVVELSLSDTGIKAGRQSRDEDAELSLSDAGINAGRLSTDEDASVAAAMGCVTRPYAARKPNLCRRNCAADVYDRKVPM